ncbi:MAG TPA: DUF86 domain-containing protein [Thermoanaerobaculia bacterium]|jgi:uncharacterized protein with HEPN domain|nr:DUF86 domain-containing protein [Thermoanaerobaculia bacterium]
MQPDQRDASYLWDMLEAVHQILDFTRGVTFSEYSQNAMLYLAVERAIQIVGEAANRVSPQFQHSQPGIPWRKIVAQRNVLVHEYGDVDPALIWDLVREYLPRLADQLEELVPPPPQDH